MLKDEYAETLTTSAEIVEDLTEQLRVATEYRNELIMAALELDATPEYIGTLTGISRMRIYQIRKADQVANAKLAAK